MKCLLIGGPASTLVYGIFVEHALVEKNLTNYGITRQVDNAILMMVGQAIFLYSQKFQNTS